MSELTKRIRAKYPQYQNLDDVELESRVVAKYPQYASLASRVDPAIMRQSGMNDRDIEQIVRNNDLQIKGSLVNFGGNLLRSAGRVVGDTLGAAANTFNPDMEKNTLANVGRVGLGAAQKLIPGQQGQEQYANQVGNYLGERYGINSALRGDFGQAAQDLRRTAYFDPSGVALDVGGLAAGGAGAARAGAMGASRSGATGVARGLGRFADDAMRVSNTLDPVYQGARGANRLANMGIRNLDDYSRNYATAGLGNPQKVGAADDILKNIKTSRVDPVTGNTYQAPMNTGDLISEANLYGRSPQDLIDYSSDLSLQFDKIANNPNLPVKVENVLAPLDKTIELTRQAIRDFPNEKSYLAQLDELVRQRNNLANKAVDGIIPGSEALRMKRSLDAVAGPKASMGVMMKPGEQVAKSKAISGLRGGLREADPRLTKIGKKLQAIGFDEIGKEGPLLKAFKGNENRANVRNPITLSNIGAGGVGAGVGAAFGGPGGAALGGFVGNAALGALSSPTGIKAVSKSGQALARGTGTAKRVSSPVVKAASQASRPGALFNRASRQSKPTSSIEVKEPPQRSVELPRTQKPKRNKSNSQGYYSNNPGMFNVSVRRN